MKAIDVHAHYLPPLLVKKLKENQQQYQFVEIEEIPKGTVRFKVGDGEWTRPVHPDLMNLEKRKESLIKNKIDFQINAGWLDIFGYNLPSEQGAKWSRFLNDTLLEDIGNEGDNMFSTLATVPLQDGNLAAEELEHAMNEGHLGVMIGSFVNKGKEGSFDLDHPSLDPFWEKASELEAPVFLHPVFAAEDARTKEYGMINTVARPGETTIALSKMLYSGILQKYPGMKLIVSHGGGSLPFILGRLKRNYQILREKGEEIYDPVIGFHQLYFDSVVFEPKALKYLISLVGENKILLGSDDPFPIRDPKPKDIIESKDSELNDNQKNTIYYENACDVFSLKVKS
ncbi:amidohydrolase family protein [Alteribacillus sp. YIM 98480]|uniref:amidohydrolase family protein n=1 Tax=Alteribacillus sp. YIM 98480 TaxID=2606599 RepID=UPI00131DAF70|nr:amidohydrolase family protein [Alteribacillus sp. YIM 98480]